MLSTHSHYLTSHHPGEAGEETPPSGGEDVTPRGACLLSVHHSSVRSLGLLPAPMGFAGPALAMASTPPCRARRAAAAAAWRRARRAVAVAADPSNLCRFPFHNEGLTAPL